MVPKVQRDYTNLSNACMPSNLQYPEPPFVKNVRSWQILKITSWSSNSSKMLVVICIKIFVWCPSFGEKPVKCKFFVYGIMCSWQCMLSLASDLLKFALWQLRISPAQTKTWAQVPYITSKDLFDGIPVWEMPYAQNGLCLRGSVLRILWLLQTIAEVLEASEVQQLMTEHLMQQCACF